MYVWLYGPLCAQRMHSDINKHSQQFSKPRPTACVTIERIRSHDGGDGGSSSSHACSYEYPHNPSRTYIMRKAGGGMVGRGGRKREREKKKGNKICAHPFMLQVNDPPCIYIYPPIENIDLAYVHVYMLYSGRARCLAASFFKSASCVRACVYV